MSLNPVSSLGGGDHPINTHKNIQLHPFLKQHGLISHFCYNSLMKWQVETLNHVVDRELEALEPSLKARFLHISELLETFGPERVGAPHVKHLVDKLWEIRMKGKSGIARAIYVTVTGRRIVVVHAFVKKTQKTPKAAIRLALERAKEIQT